MKKEISEVLKDDLTRDIMTFFYQNQASIDSVGGVSAWVQSDRKKVKSILDALVKLGVLEKDTIGSMNGYCYTRDEKTMKIIKDLMSNV